MFRLRTLGIWLFVVNQASCSLLQIIKSKRVRSRRYSANAFMPYSVTVYSLNEHRQVQHQQSTDILTLSMLRNSEERLICFDANMQYPLMVSVNVLLTTPGKVSEELSRWAAIAASDT